MIINIKDYNTIILVKVSGELNAETYQDFIHQLKIKLQSSIKDVVLDLTNLNYISSAGLRAILIIAKELDTVGNKLIICGLSKQVENIFNISGFNEIFPIYENFETVRENFQIKK